MDARNALADRSVQGRVTCDAVAGEGGRRMSRHPPFACLAGCLTSPTHRLPSRHRNVPHSWLLNGGGAQIRIECGLVAWRLSGAAIRRSVMAWGRSALRPGACTAMALF